MNPTRNEARVAGLLYLLVTIASVFGVLFVQGVLIASGDAATTAERILASESLYRWGMASEAIAALAFAFVVMALYRIFKPVNQQQAGVMAILALLSVPISFVGLVSEMAALAALNGGEFLTVFTRPQVEALAYLFLRLHSQGMVVAGIFFGLWLLPLGLLVIRSRFVPRFVGLLVILAGAAYVVSSFTSLVLPRYAQLVSSFATPAYAGELAIVLWLLFSGFRPNRRDNPN